jgi:hypothetical protein
MQTRWRQQNSKLIDLRSGEVERGEFVSNSVIKLDLAVKVAIRINIGSHLRCEGCKLWRLFISRSKREAKFNPDMLSSDSRPLKGE